MSTVGHRKLISVSARGMSHLNDVHYDAASAGALED